MKSTFVFFILTLALISCNKNRNAMSIVAFSHSCNLYENTDEINSFHFDSIKSILTTADPDLINFQSSNLSDSCKNYLTTRGYEILELNDSINDIFIIKHSSFVYKSHLFNILSSSMYTLETDELNTDKNLIDWVKLKNKKSGYIFYIYKLKLQPSLNTHQSKVLSIEILKYIDNTSAGVPVILIGDMEFNNLVVNEMLTRHWKDMYTFYNVNKPKNSKTIFFLNDYFEITNCSIIKLSILNSSNINVKFTKNTANIERNKNGEELPSIN